MDISRPAFVACNIILSQRTSNGHHGTLLASVSAAIQRKSFEPFTFLRLELIYEFSVKLLRPQMIPTALLVGLYMMKCLSAAGVLSKAARTCIKMANVPPRDSGATVGSEIV